MGKTILGLDDRSARLLHGKDVWTQIKGLLTGCNNIEAAIAYVGADADYYLSLRAPATIVVNAGDEALANGWTDPAVLLRWTRRGVRVHSLPSLHAKVLVAHGSPAFVLVGSADVLSTSGKPLHEAVLVADEMETVNELSAAVRAWQRLAGEPLTDEWLQSATLRYRAAGGSRRTEPAVTSAQPGLTPAQPNVTSAQTLVTSAQSLVTSAQPFVTSAQPDDRPAQPPTSGPPSPASVSDPALAQQDAAPPVAQQAAMSPSAGEPLGTTLPAERDPTEAPAVSWPRPKFIYLATLTRDGHASASAQHQLQQLRADHRVPVDGAQAPLLDVEMFWWDAPGRSSGKAKATYRQGWHVVPISVPASGRPAILSPVHSPGLVLHTFTEYSGGPPRTYYYLLTPADGLPTTFRKLREALTAVGEKPSYDHAYMMKHKVSAILDLWPDIDYES